MGLEFDTEKGDDLETIRQRLTEAAVWFEIAEQRPKSGFPRSVELHPSHFYYSRKSLVRDVAYLRSRALKEYTLTASGRAEGRLLCYAPDETVDDGASEAVTNGFVDIRDEPPWDLWLGYVVETGDRAREYLVCWIPPVFVETVELGIEVNPVACIECLPELEQELGLGLKPDA
jgi:hypothetical protein